MCNSQFWWVNPSTIFPNGTSSQSDYCTKDSTFYWPTLKHVIKNRLNSPCLTTRLKQNRLSQNFFFTLAASSEIQASRTCCEWNFLIFHGKLRCGERELFESIVQSIRMNRENNKNYGNCNVNVIARGSRFAQGFERVLNVQIHSSDRRTCDEVFRIFFRLMCAWIT